MSDRLDTYLLHKTLGTAPKSGIPYTKQSRVRPANLFPQKSVTELAAYIKDFEGLNHLKEIPE